MKKIIIFTLILICFGSKAQNPELFQTWYLTFVQGSDQDVSYTVSEIMPAVMPTLVISEDMSFSGSGACNTFQGEFMLPGEVNVDTIQFGQTSQTCVEPIHNWFEESYFGFLGSGGEYYITQAGDDSVLTINNAIFGQAVFRNHLLKRENFYSDEMSVYPNPVHDVLNFSSPAINISDLQVYDVFGNAVLSGNSIDLKSECINLSPLSKGVYFIKIQMADGRTFNKKVLKD